MFPEKAKEFAIEKHGEQKYGDLPYVEHLQGVVDVLLQYGHGGDDVLIASAWLHDVLEDTDANKKDIYNQFGRSTSEIVWALTGEGNNRSEKFLSVVPKLQANKKALMIKLADRIANVTSSLSARRYSLYEMYQKEFPEFKKHLYRETDQPEVLMLWEKLFSLFE